VVLRRRRTRKGREEERARARNADAKDGRRHEAQERETDTSLARLPGTKDRSGVR